MAKNYSKDGGAFWGDSGRDAKPGFGVKHGSKKNKGEKVSLKTVQGVTHGSAKAEQVRPLNGFGENSARFTNVPHVGGSRENEYVANCGRGAREKDVLQENRDKGGRKDPEKDRALRLDNKS